MNLNLKNHKQKDLSAEIGDLILTDSDNHSFIFVLEDYTNLIYLYHIQKNKTIVLNGKDFYYLEEKFSRIEVGNSIPIYPPSLSDVVKITDIIKCDKLEIVVK